MKEATEMSTADELATLSASLAPKAGGLGLNAGSGAHELSEPGRTGTRYM